MALNSQDNQPVLVKRVLFVVLLAASLICVTLYAREGDEGPIHSVQARLSDAFSPLRGIGAGFGSVVGNVGTSVGDATADPTTLSALREQNAQLTQALTNAEEYRQEAERLRDALKLRDTYNIDGVAARIIGRSTDAWNQTITIDVGSNAGVQEGLTVVGGTGVIGQVITVAPNSSTVRLLTDPNSGAAAIIQSSRAEGVVRGSLDGLLYLENVDADTPVNVGDVVLTSGLGGSYVRGLLIGSVVRVDGSTGSATRRIVVAPNETVNVLEEVIVVFSASSNFVPTDTDSGDAQVPINSGDTGDASGDTGESDSGDTGEGDESSDDTYVDEYSENDVDDTEYVDESGEEYSDETGEDNTEGDADYDTGEEGEA